MSITSEDTFEELTLAIESDSNIVARCYRNRDGEIHRRHGPAVILHNGTQEWYLYGKRHRVGGPAIVWPDGTEDYWINGEHFYRV